jgi:hypothetical protein
MHRYRLPSVQSTYPPTREGDNDPLISGPAEPVFDHDEEVAQAEEGEMIPYAHRDIKPGSVAFNSLPLLYRSTTNATLRLTPQKHHDRR